MAVPIAAAAAIALRAAAQTSPAPNTPPPALQAGQVIAHLQATIGWFHHMEGVEQQSLLPPNAASRGSLQQSALTSLRLAFAFARAATSIAGGSSPTGSAGGAPGAAPPAQGTGNGQPGNLPQASARLAQRVADLQARLNAVNGELARAPARSRSALTAQRDELTAALALAKDVQGTIDHLARFAASSSGTGAANSLTARIDQLERSVPEAQSPAAGKPAAGTAAVAASAGSPTMRPESAGLVALATELFAIGSTRRQLHEAIDETDGLLEEITKLRAPLLAEARQFAGRADLGALPPANSADAARTRRSLQDAAARFKIISTVLVPLSEQAIAVQTGRSTLVEWRDQAVDRFGTTLWYLLLRGGMLVLALVVILLVSEAWRRATFRYLHDARRRAQFLVLRRVVVGVAAAIVLVVGLVSQIGSLATYAGFVTAGVAVAMQNVILAIVAYFFLIGRYGVRVGDRITLGGVTGNVIEIGLVRIYLMELAGADLHPTGRIVVLSNAVLFQPAAMFKQVPGADYVWHTMTVTLAAGADPGLAERRLEAAAESVYDGYREAIERQHANLQRFVEVETSKPAPDVRAHLTAAGLECTLRYPVDVQRAAEIDRAMLDAIRTALARESQLTLVSTTRPSLQQTA